MIRLLCLLSGGHKCIQQSNERSLAVLTSEPHHYTFDAVAGEDADQTSIFQGTKSWQSFCACVPPPEIAWVGCSFHKHAQGHSTPAESYDAVL